MAEAKFKIGQIVIYTGKKLIPLRVLAVMEEDGEWFYQIDRKNWCHEPMLRSLTEAEKGVTNA